MAISINRHTIQRWGTAILLVFSIVLSIVYLFYGVGSQRDQFYWMSLFGSYATEPMTSLTLWIGNIWCTIFSQSILSLRILKWILEMASFAFAFSIIPKRVRHNSFLVLAISILLMGYGFLNEFSPTVLTNFFIVVLAFLLKQFNNTDNPIWTVILLSVISGLAISARFPNVVILFIISISILCLRPLPQKHIITTRIVYALIYLALSVTLYWIVMSVLTSSSFSFSQLASSFSQATNHSHSINALYQQYLWDFPIFFDFFASAFLFSISLLIYKDSRINTKWKIAISTISIVIFCLYFIKCIGFHKWNNTLLYYFISASVLAVTCIGLYQKITKKKKESIAFLVIIIALCFVSTIGSDTRSLKLFPIVLYFLPYIYGTSISDDKYDFLFLPLPLLLGLCSVMCYLGNPVNNIDCSPLWKGASKLQIPVYNGILLSKTDYDIAEKIISDSTEYLGPKTAYGNFAPFISIVSNGEIQNGNKNEYQFDFYNRLESMAEISKNSTLFISKDNSDSFQEFIDFFAKKGYLVIDEMPIYYILKYNGDHCCLVN